MGKSTLARLVLMENKIPYVSTDGLTVMLKPIGQPSFYSVEKSNLFFPYLELFISRITKSCPDYLIEGDSFTPEQVEILQNKYELKSVFLTMSHTTVENIINNTGYDKWSDEASPEQLNDLVQRIHIASKDIQQECTKRSLNCFDLSENYDAVLYGAYRSLMS